MSAVADLALDLYNVSLKARGQETVRSWEAIHLDIQNEFRAIAIAVQSEDADAPVNYQAWRNLAERRKAQLIKLKKRNKALKDEIESFRKSQTAFRFVELSEYAEAQDEEPKRKRGRPRLTVCKRGHDLTIDGARYQSGQCRKCKQQWKADQEHKAA
jgi:hypothetical protein